MLNTSSTHPLTPTDAGYLLELTSVITATGAVVHKALVQGDTGPDAPIAVAPADHDFEKAGRYFKFWLTDRQGNKLVRQRGTGVSALVSMMMSYCWVDQLWFQCQVECILLPERYCPVAAGLAVALMSLVSLMGQSLWCGLHEC